MKKIKVLLLILFSINMMNAQVFEYKTGADLDLSSGYNYGDYLVNKNGKHYFFFEKERTISIVSCNENFDDVFIDEIRTENSSTEHIDLLYSSDRFGWLTYRNNFKKKQFEYELTPIDLDGNFGRIKKVINLRYKSERRIPTTKIKYSQDSSKIMFVFELDFDRTDDYAAYIIVMDYDFNVLWQKDYYPKINQRKFEPLGWEISNNGEVYALNKVYEDNDKDEDKKIKGQHYPAYTVVLNKFYSEGENERILDSDGRFIKTATLKCDANSNIMYSFGYGYRDGDPIEGFVFHKLSQIDFNSIDSSEFAFTDESIAAYSKVDVLKNSRGIGLVDNFEFEDVILTSEGGCKLILVDHRVVVDRYNNGFNSFNRGFYAGGQTQTTYIDLSVVALSINNQGEFIDFTLIPRRFESSDATTTGIKSFNNGDEVLLFYNDDQSNLDDILERDQIVHIGTRRDVSYFVTATLFPDRVYDRSALMGFRELDGHINPQSIHYLSKDKFFFAVIDESWSKGKYRVGLMDLNVEE